MNFTHDDQYLRDLLIHVIEEDAEDCPHPLSASAPRETGEEPPLPEEETLPREEAPPVPEEKSPPQDTPTPPRGGSLSEEEVMELAWQVSRMRLDTQREIRQLVSLLEEQTRKGADSAARNRREGRRCRSYGFIAGAALVMAGLCAEGTTKVENIHFIERGYENLIEKMAALGATIRRIDD